MSRRRSGASPDMQAKGADLGLLVARLVVGTVFVVHGAQKLSQGLDVTAAMFDGLGVPFPAMAAVAQTALELAGGVALGLGALTRLAGGLLAVSMLGAIWFAHVDAGFAVADGGYEYPLVLATTSALIATLGAGRWSVDGLRAARPDRAAVTGT